MKKELPSFQPQEKAIIYDTPGWEFENTTCTVVGISTKFAENNNFYIVELEKPTSDGWTHTALTNACLKKIPD